MLNELKREILMAELKKRGVHRIGGLALISVEYRMLRSVLAIKRVLDQ